MLGGLNENQMYKLLKEGQIKPLRGGNGESYLIPKLNIISFIINQSSSQVAVY